VIEGARDHSPTIPNQPGFVISSAFSGHANAMPHGKLSARTPHYLSDVSANGSGPSGLTVVQHRTKYQTHEKAGDKADENGMQRMFYGESSLSVTVLVLHCAYLCCHYLVVRCKARDVSPKL
jgi:hypothetical protein